MLFPHRAGHAVVEDVETVGGQHAARVPAPSGVCRNALLPSGQKCTLSIIGSNVLRTGSWEIRGRPAAILPMRVGPSERKALPRTGRACIWGPSVGRVAGSVRTTLQFRTPAYPTPR